MGRYANLLDQKGVKEYKILLEENQEPWRGGAIFVKTKVDVHNVLLVANCDRWEMRIYGSYGDGRGYVEVTDNWEVPF